MSKDSLALALERAAQIMAGTVTYVGWERDLARALIKLWQQSNAAPQDAKPLGAEVNLPAVAAPVTPRPEGGARLALLGIERMLESVQEDLRNQDPGNHATIAALHGEGKGLTAAKMLLEGAIRGHHGDHVRSDMNSRPITKEGDAD